MSVHDFRGSAGPTLGVELELQLIDARSMALTGAVDGILSGTPEELRESIKPEFYDCCVEINTDVCHGVPDVERDLGLKLAATAQVASRQGVLLGWGGTHPFSHWLHHPVVPTPRYLELAEHYRETLCRQLTFGLHVHVGVPNGDAAVRVCNRITEHLPALLALSANSPFWCGRATGLHSHRVEVMSASPTGGFPPQLGGWGDFMRLVDRLTHSGLIQSPKELWWDVRPSPDHGTVEVRMCDMPADLPSVLGLTALTQCLVVELAREGNGDSDLGECRRMILRQNRWRAARFGLGADLVDVRSGTVSPARDALKAMIVRLWGTAEALGCAHQLAQVWAGLDGSCGAERQLAIFERTGDLAAVVRHTIGGSTPDTGHPVAASHNPAGLGGDRLSVDAQAGAPSPVPVG